MYPKILISSERKGLREGEGEGRGGGERGREEGERRGKRREGRPRGERRWGLPYSTTKNYITDPKRKFDIFYCKNQRLL